MNIEGSKWKVHLEWSVIMERLKRINRTCINLFMARIKALFDIDSDHTSHPHRCGEGKDGFDSTRGCGHVWDHPRVDSSPDAVHARNHICPKCGKGPWYYIAGSVMRGRMMGRL